MTKNINTSKEDAGHDNACQEEKKEGLITLFLLHSILKGKNPRIAQVVYLVPHVRSPF